MDFARNLRSRIGLWYRPRPLHVALEHSALFSKMPPELILHISSFLLPHSTTLLSLSCRFMYFTLGTKHLQEQDEPEPKKFHRHNMLVLLERDLPDHILCFYCDRLHSMKKARRRSHYAVGVLNSECRHNESNPTPFEPVQGFSSILFQMTMKRYRQGLDHSSFSRDLPYPTLKEPAFFGFIEQATSSMKIVNGSFLFREQKIISNLKAAPIPLPDMACFVICPHYTFRRTGRFTDSFSPLLRDQWADPLDHKQWKGMIECAYCYTEFRIDFREYETSNHAIYVTVWKDFGRGMSPPDSKWQSHTYRYKRERRPLNTMRGSICAAYEEEDHIPHDEFDFRALQTPYFEMGRWDKFLLFHAR